MTQNQNIETYQIRVNRLFSEKEKFIPYSKYIKNDYPQLSKVVPKHSILYKAKNQPEIVINEFHQTSNNFNTNINIKANPSENLDSYNFNSKLNELSNTFQNNDYINYNTKNYYSENPFKNNNYIYNHRTNLSENLMSYQKIQDNNNTEKKLIDFILQHRNNTKDRNTISFNNITSNNSYSDLKYSNKSIEVKRKNDNEIKSHKVFNTTKYNKYYKNKNLSMNLIEQYNKVYNTEVSETSIESLSNKENKINKILFSSGKKNKKDFENKNKNHIFKNKNWDNIKDITAIKMEIYRIKLFREFFKHFKKYYKSYIKIYYYYFLNKLKNNKYYIKIKTNSKTIDNYYPNREKNSFNLLNENKTNINVIDNIKSSITKDFNRKTKINSNFNNKILKKNKPVNYNFNKINNNNNYNKHLPIYSHFKKIQNTTPRINKNFDLLVNNKRKGYNSPSPFFRIGNKIIINREISFGKESKDENELFRDSKELNKKFEQIKRRKKLSFFNKTAEIINNKSVENFKNRKNTIYNITDEFDEIRKYIQENKKNNHKINRNTVDGRKDKNESSNFIKIIDGDEVNEINNNELKDKELNNKDKDNKDNKIMKVNINKNLLDNYGKRIISKDNNNKIISNVSNNKNIAKNNKDNIYYSKNKINKINKLYSIVVKDILTKDKLIHIHINYLFLTKKNKSLKKRYNFLQQDKNCSICLLSSGKKEKKNDLKLTNKLSSIKEEDFSIHNSNIYDEIDNIKNNDKTILLIFIEKIYNILIKKYKKNFFYKIKTIELVYKINNIFNNQKEIEKDDIKKSNKDNIKKNNNKIYNKKRGVNKIEDINSPKNNKDNYKIFENKIDKLRFKLINYFIFFYSKK